MSTDITFDSILRVTTLAWLRQKEARKEAGVVASGATSGSASCNYSQRGPRGLAGQ